MKNCSVKGCFADCQTGDNLFCSDCRKLWLRFCKRLGITESSITPQEEMLCLSQFRERLLK